MSRSVPTVLQMEAAECGAASLGMVLGAYGRFVPLETLRTDCGVSRSGARASDLYLAAERHGLQVRAFKKEPAQLRDLPVPMIVHWSFDHFLVVEGFTRRGVILNDPALGRRIVDEATFDESFTGVVLTFQPGPDFQPQGRPPGVLAPLAQRVRRAWPTLSLVVLSGFLAVATGLLVPGLARLFVDGVLVGGNTEWARPLLVALALAALVQMGLVRLQLARLADLEVRLSTAMSSRFLWRLLHLPWAFFTSRYPGDLSRRVSTNDTVAGLLSGQLATTVLNGLLVVFYIVLMALYDPLLALVAAAGSAAGLASMVHLQRRQADSALRLSVERSLLFAATVRGLSNIEVIQATSPREFFGRWAGLNASLKTAEQDLASGSLWIRALPALIGGLTNALVLWVGASRVLGGSLTLGGLAAFQALLLSLGGPLAQLVAALDLFHQVGADLRRLEDVDGGPDAPAAEGLAEPLRGEVELDGVTFGYASTGEPLLRDFHLHLRPGARVALVGASGSGKSTVARLLVGLLQPWSGEIRLDGRPRGAYTPAALGRQVALVSRDGALFHATVRDNLSLWDPTIPSRDLVRAATDAHLYAELAARPGALEHEVAEGGRNFSGGQAQRLQIARALALDPAVLVLDEATSALDPPTEEEVDQAIRRRGCTCLIVAHRLSTVRDADEILVLDRGRVAERGTHDELMARDGLYARLARQEEP